MVVLLLDHGASIDAGNHRNWTPLMLACQEGHISVVETLLDAGANVNAQTSARATCLMAAVKTQDQGLIRLLVQRGADVDEKDREGFTALHFCAQSGNDVSAKALLANDTSVNAKNKVRPLLYQYPFKRSLVQDGRTPLMIATSLSTTPMMRVLLGEGADPNIKDNRGMTALVIAERLEDAEKVDLLKQFGARKAETTERQQTQNPHHETDHNVARKSTPLMKAAFHGKVSLVEECMRSGHSVHDKNENGQTAMHYAAIGGDAEIGRMLLDAGCGLEGDAVLSPLCLALQSGSTRFVRFLLGVGANPRAKGPDGRSCMHFAVIPRSKPNRQEMYIELIRLLQKQGIAIDDVDDKGHTPLHVATAMSVQPAVVALLYLGAKISARDHEGHTPLNYACMNRTIEVVRTLVEDGGASVQEQSDNGFHPLYIAAGKGNVPLVRYLLYQKAPIDLANRAGITPLMIAIMADRSNEVVKILIRNGANVNVINEVGATPLHIATERGNVDNVRYLVTHGADVTIKTNDELTAMRLAVLRGYDDIAALLSPKSPIRSRRQWSSFFWGNNSTTITTTAAQLTSTRHDCSIAMEEDMFCCPITLDVMKDPVVAGDGHTYEREAIIGWINTHGRSPVTNQTLTTELIVPNLHLKHQIDVFRRSRE